MQYHKVTANLIVSDIDASIRFYVDVLGLVRHITVPEQPPFVFVGVGTEKIEIFLNKDEQPGKLKRAASAYTSNSKAWTSCWPECSSTKSGSRSR